MDGLAGIDDPEKKRKFIGGEFIAVFEEEAQKLGVLNFWRRELFTLMSLKV